MADLRSLVERKLDPVGRSGRDIIYLCPECDDTSGHLYVDYDKSYWHCFRCDIGGKRIESLLRLLNINVDYDYDKIYSEQDKELDSIISTKEQKPMTLTPVDYSTDLDTLTEYFYSHVQGLSERAYLYLCKRGIDDRMIYHLNIYEGINRFGDKLVIKGKGYLGRDYSGRILIPSLRRDGRISFYVARDYIGDKQAKYLNPPKDLAYASEDVWNLDRVESDSVIICEGVITAIAASPYKLNAVATYGKSIAERSSNDSGILVTSQGEKLLNRRFKNYYVCYDADARESSIKTCKYLYDRGANVYQVIIDPKKYGAKADVADIGYKEFLKLMEEAPQYDGFISDLTL